MTKNLSFLFTCLFCTSFLFSCTESNETQSNSDTEEDTVASYTGEVINSEKQQFGVDTISAELENPWGIAFLPDGRILVTEKAGEIRIIQDGELLEEKIAGVPEVFAKGQGGLLDIKLHPDYDENGWIYITYSKPGEGGGGTTLARAKLEGNSFTNFEELFVARPFTDAGQHFGSRIAFDNDGFLYVSTGERGEKENAQDLSNHYGKIHRLHDDGTIPDDNPFVDTADAQPSIWSYGHRNVQGMVYDAASERLWAHEHGPQGGDETNIVEKGKNYGWPIITYGINYDNSQITDITEREDLEQPVHYWVPSIAPCGMALVTSDRYPNWTGNLMVGSLKFRYVVRLELDGTEYVDNEILLEEVGRVRAVVESPDGYIYVATEGPGMLLKLIPVE